jgi:hypothetical protein
MTGTSDEGTEANESGEPSGSLRASLSRRSVLSGSLLVGVTGLFGGASAWMALFDRNPLANNDVQAGKLDLGIAWDAYRNEIKTKSVGSLQDGVYVDSQEVAFTAAEVEPGDQGTVVVSIRSDGSPAVAWMRLTPIAYDENDRLQVERDNGDETPNEGELQDALQLTLWRASNNDTTVDSEPIFEGRFSKVAGGALGDGLPLNGDPADSIDIGLQWALPDDPKATVATDSVEFILEFALQQKRHNENPDNPWL